MTRKNKFSIRTFAGLLVAAFCWSAVADDHLPPVTEDGLILIPSKNVAAVYWREGATLAPYDQVILMDAMVAFRKDWQREHNQRAATSAQRITAADMDRIKSALADAFRQEFTLALGQGGFDVVSNSGNNVMVIRPAIVDLDIVAPNSGTAGRTRSFTTTAGSMTLVMELFDSVTGAKIGQVFDAQAARDSGMFVVSNNVTNTAEARRIMNRWATLLVAALQEAHGRDTASDDDES